ncbi:MAG: chorismate mutase [Gammaproteobacteria bacterium]|nr:chorismate mutase [Gammaproteobacteria bacterium]|tara:strand:- start:193 stop:483 length:291 start_codon:yes stop_codon:yes gene_type:complete
MTNQLANKQLLEARQKIDEIDSKLIETLDERFRLTWDVGLLKAENKLDPLDKVREAEKLAKLRSLCNKNTLNPDFIEEIFSRIMEEVVKNHQSIER